jgi:hypothetical protein
VALAGALQFGRFGSLSRGRPFLFLPYFHITRCRHVPVLLMRPRAGRAAANCGLQVKPALEAP